MPTIKVNERDLSWYYRQRQPGQITVLMPGVATFGPSGANEGSLVLVNESNFIRTLGSSSVDSRDFSYNVAKSYVKSGIDVLFWRVPLPGQTTAYYNFEKSIEKNLFESTGNGQDRSFVLTTDSTEFSLDDPNVTVTITKATVGGVNKAYSYDDASRIITFEEVPDDGVVVNVEYTAKVRALTINAKYPGTFGNSLSVEVSVVSKTSNIYRVLVYNNNTTLVENLLVDFTDMDSEYYYTTINFETNYVEFVPGTLKSLSLPNEKLPLENGSNGEYSVEAVTDYLSGSQSSAVWNDLQDPLSNVFNVVTSSGYNSYNRFVYDTYVTNVYYKEEGSGTPAEHSFVEISIKDTSVTIPNIEIEGLIKGTPVHYYYIDKDGNEVEADPEDVTTSITKVVIDTAFKVDDKLVKYNKGDYIKVVAITDSILSISQIDDKFIGLCESTGLAIYLVDGKQDWTAEEFYNYTSLPTQTITAGKYAPTGFNTSYAAAIGPWCSAILVATGLSRMLPGSYVFLTQWAQSLASGTPMYYAPAGIKRASLNFVNSTAYPVGSAVLDLWQNHDIVTTDTHKVIPIANIRQYGYVIYGNSTLLKDLADGTSSMLQSLSTRIVANMIKSVAFDISLTLQFDQISTDLFVEFREKLNTFMSQLKYNNALYDYEIVADTTSLSLDDLNSRTVPVIIRISPTPAAENFDITLEISQAGVTFGVDDTQNTTTES